MESGKHIQEVLLGKKEKDFQVIELKEMLAYKKIRRYLEEL